MNNDSAQQLMHLASSLHDTRNLPLGGAILFIGGAASSIQGHSAIDELRRQVLLGISGGLTEEQFSRMSPSHQISLFEETWSNWGNNQKVVQWRSLHEQLRPTKGHNALAFLLKENYFPLVLTSTIDLLMESVFISHLVSEGQPLRPWSVLVNGRDTPENIRDAIQSMTAYTPTTLFLKLCGDIQSSTFAVTQGEVQARAQAISSVLDMVLQGLDLIIVGFTPLDDVLIQGFPSVVEGKVTFIGTERPELFSGFENHRWHRPPTYIIDSNLTFDLIFQTIAERNKIQEIERPDRATQGSQTPKEDLMQIIKTEQRQESVNKSPLVVLVEATIFTVKVDASRHVSFEVVGGRFNYTSEGSQEWKVDMADLNLVMQDMGRNIATYHRHQDQSSIQSWRRQALREGQRLYADLFEAYPDLVLKLKIARQMTSEDPQNLTLVFSGPHEYLAMPYELLVDEKAPLVVSHPLCRKVSDVNVQHSEPFNTLVRTLRRKKQRLCVLLIASDRDTLSVNQEVTELKTLLSRKAQQVALPMDFEVLLAEQASLQEVKKRLTKCTYHLVHYAGVGTFDEAAGENSGLQFWQQGEQGNEQAILTARELAALLAGSETRLFYLSTSGGTWTGNDQMLRDNGYLGVMDALVQAGIPYVLGFRWYIPDGARRRFAQLFYDHLFTGRLPVVPEWAAWYARKQIYEAKGETWTSPVLIAQVPYFK